MQRKLVDFGLSNLILSALALLVIFLIKELFQWYKFVYKVNLPRWKPWPFLGHFPYFVKFGQSFQRSFQQGLLVFREELEKGDGIGQLIFGYKRIVWITNAEYGQQLLCSQDHIDKTGAYKIFPWMEGGLLTSGGQRWRQNRRLLTPIMNLKIPMESNLVTFNQKAISLCDYIEKQPDKLIDVCNVMLALTFDNVAEYMLGYSFDTVQNGHIPYSHWRKECIDIGLVQVSTPIFRIKRIWQNSRECKRMTKNVRRIKEFLGDVIQKHIDKNGHKLNPDSNDCFLTHLLKIYDNEAGYHKARQEVSTFISAAIDTTTNALVWCFLRLTEFPHIQEKLHEELDSFFGKQLSEFTIEDIKKLQYLECFLKESLRSAPPIPSVGRKLAADTKFGKYLVPANTDVVVDTMAIQMDPRYYKNPENFDPERWMDPETSRDRYHFIPFAAGPRKCIGDKFAWYELKVTMAILMHRYRVTAISKYPYTPIDIEVVPVPQGPIWIQFHNRN